MGKVYQQYPSLADESVHQMASLFGIKNHTTYNINDEWYLTLIMLL